MYFMDNYIAETEYSDHIHNAVRYGYLYRKQAEQDTNTHNCFDDVAPILLWIAQTVISGLAWDVIKSIVKQLYKSVHQKDIIIDYETEAILSDEEQLKEFYEYITEYNNQLMIITREQFSYIREEIIADYLGEETAKIHKQYNRLPTTKEYTDILEQANFHAEKLLGKYK